MNAETDAEAIDPLIGKMRAAAAPFRKTLQELHRRHAGLADGAVATYIPELALADPSWFGISVATVDGLVFEIGDSGRPFSIQSISKPFVFGMALQDHGRDGVLRRVGVEPTGEAFNAIILDEATNRPFNPMVNAGAIATTDLIEGADAGERFKRLMAMFRRFTGRDVHIDNAVFLSERTTGHRNRAIAHLMRNFGMVGDRVEESLELYFQQCSALVTCRDLAVMGATLADGGRNPLTGETALEPSYVKDVLSIMLTCGMYDFAGEWAYRTGLPAKSGVAGGIVAVVPGVAGIGVYSPPLDAKGNSVRGIRVCQDLSQEFGLHAFEARFAGASLRDSCNPPRRGG
ncbi:Glutaminase 1 [Aquisphaera giovannonii]|uniref:Glutaminase n=2 Tax=Aquisphaera giovannonii TaxID=406548 RepID=A0A5B9VVW4_9BACT|nr:glutaminase A [Aquisphaera giovannonii]QEH32001.1 Glutaminase 1 [Aquisphaera giovannonii]